MEDTNILGEYENIELTTLLRTFRKEGIENFVVVRKNKLENLIKVYKELEEENRRLKASHIVTHNKISDEEKAKIFDVIDNSIDTYFEKSKPYWEQIITKDKMSLEEAETIINDMYQDRNKILENNNVIDISRLDDVKFTNLEFASVRAIREIQSLERKLDNSISASLVEEKIEELDEELEIMKVDAMYGRYKEYGSKLSFEKQFSYKYGMHDILQELLEKRK